MKIERLAFEEPDESGVVVLIEEARRLDLARGGEPGGAETVGFVVDYQGRPRPASFRAAPSAVPMKTRPMPMRVEK